MTTSHRFVFVNERTFEDVTASETRAYESREERQPHPVTKIEWEGMWGNPCAANFQFGYALARSRRGVPGRDPVGREDVDSERVTGENVVNGELAFRQLLSQTRGS